MKRKDHHLVQRVLDGDVSAEEFAEFQRRMREDPVLEEGYKGYALVHHTLSEEFETGEGGAGVGARGIGRGWVMALVGLLLVLAGALIWWQVWSGAGKVARVEFSEDALWKLDGGGSEVEDGYLLSGGTGVKLAQGRLKLSMREGGLAVAEAPLELKVLDGGRVELDEGVVYFQKGGETRVSASSGERMVVSDGDALMAVYFGRIRKISEEDGTFPTELGGFRTVFESPFVRERWRFEYGEPVVAPSHVDGANFEAFLKLPEMVPGPGDRVLLATLEVGKSAFGEFHTDGWAGLSFYYEGEEVLFFGDAFGEEKTWALDVKQEQPVIKPQPPLTDERRMTLRYDPKTGVVTLHPGGVPLAAAVCEGKLAPGSMFDEIRLGASVGAAISVRDLRVRVGVE